MSVAVNGGMPVRASALEAAGVISEGEPVEVDDPRHLETADDPVPVLGDVLPVPLTNEVLSFGDLIVIVGAADAVRELSRRRRAPLAVAAAQRPVRTASTSVDQVWGTAPSGVAGVGHPVLGEPGALHARDDRPHRAPSRRRPNRSWWRRARAGR